MNEDTIYKITNNLIKKSKVCSWDENYKFTRNVNIKEVPFVQKEEKDSISKTAPNIKTFLYMGIKYLIRIIVTKFRN